MINTDNAPAYAAALAEKAEGKCPERLVHRQAKHLDNGIEADHGKLKQLGKPVRGFKTLTTACATGDWAGEGTSCKPRLRGLLGNSRGHSLTPAVRPLMSGWPQGG